ncbi:MAG TPA: helix-turn-helix domain-containing protein, partial [Candidatus Obscuribacter sp.]|nr:helix-turn-helix domain-containing protein [Candidatus Obscuribacter sp.]
MNYAQCHMNATARDFNSEIQQADTNGLDALFDAEVLPGTTSDYQVVPTIGVSVQEAAKVLGLSVKTVKDRLRKGTLAGFKKKDKFGDAWLVSLEQSGLVGTTRDYQVGPTEDSGLVGTTRDYQVGPTEDSGLVGTTRDYQVGPTEDSGL